MFLDPTRIIDVLSYKIIIVCDRHHLCVTDSRWVDQRILDYGEKGNFRQWSRQYRPKVIGDVVGVLIDAIDPIILDP